MTITIPIISAKQCCLLVIFKLKNFNEIACFLKQIASVDIVDKEDLDYFCALNCIAHVFLTF